MKHMISINMDISVKSMKTVQLRLSVAVKESVSQEMFVTKDRRLLMTIVNMDLSVFQDVVLISCAQMWSNVLRHALQILIA